MAQLAFLRGAAADLGLAVDLAAADLLLRLLVELLAAAVLVLRDFAAGLSAAAPLPLLPPSRLDFSAAIRSMTLDFCGFAGVLSSSSAVTRLPLFLSFLSISSRSAAT